MIPVVHVDGNAIEAGKAGHVQNLSVRDNVRDHPVAGEEVSIPEAADPPVG